MGNADGMQICLVRGFVVTFYVMASWKGAVSHWVGPSDMIFKLSTRVSQKFKEEIYYFFRR